ncbi:MAG: hypothetical protein SAJ12_02295 [Jaaginema sp. PMC 1079.18]|nr:hypothetical protein [Jaaginema sp. PMC 1080.18]MEC4849819.1 hypothetical protein [Jaaginema sp. PMC 1079.18]MEC4865263.1 hypothetical protein [Jaaginema sp. PMC 1078.18]
MQLYSTNSSQRSFWVQAWLQLVAVVGVVNLLLVLFNLSYLPLRDIYVREVPDLVTLYDPIKNIEPHPETQRYLESVDFLAGQINRFGLDNKGVIESFGNLRRQSVDMLAENPFSAANKFGTFAKLKRRMEYQLETLSAQQAFERFWNPAYFAQEGTEKALSFFDGKIRPLLAVNYFRSVDDNGQYRDRFWQIDSLFVSFFILEFLVRTLIISRRQKDLSWGDAMLRRWYESFLFFPVWRWLRIIPVGIRLHKSGLVNMERVLAQVTHEPAAYLADRVSVFLMVRLINQTQDAVESGAITRSLLEPGDYVQLGDVNKVDAIIDRILELSIYQVLPEVQPDLEVVLHHSLRGALKESDFYQGLRRIPGLEAFPQEAVEQLADYLSKALIELLATSYGDVEGRVLFDQLSDRFKRVFRRELQDKATQTELQNLLGEFLEEIKINYVQRSQDHDPEAILTEAEQIRDRTL